MTEDIYFDPGATRTMGSVIRVKFKHMLSGPGEPKPDPNIHYNDYHEGQQYVVYYDCVAGLTSGIVAPQMQEDMEPKILQKDPLYLVPYQHQKHYPVITDDNIVAKVCD